MKESNLKKFILLWTGELISSIGGGLTSFGLGVYVFGLTGSAGKMAIITLIGFLPTLLLSMFAGVLADKYDRRILMMLGDGLSAIGVIYILICLQIGKGSFINICIGVLVSSVFSSLLEPAYRATVSDILTKDEYAKASGLVSLAGSARYLISPLIAGLLLAVCDIKVLLIIDISTFVLTVITTFVVKKGIVTKERVDEESMLKSLSEGFEVLKSKKGVLALVGVASLLTLFMGVFQILAEPMILSFSDAKTLGIAETICASGMLVSSLVIGIKGMKSNFVKILSASLSCSGIFIALFGIWENVILMAVFGFGFFLMIPVANTCLDYLVRTNIDEQYQGRVWGIIGFLSQIGYVVAYGISGLLADSFASRMGISVGRGAAIVVKISGCALLIVAVVLLMIKCIRSLEVNSEDEAVAKSAVSA